MSGAPMGVRYQDERAFGRDEVHSKSMNSVERLPFQPDESTHRDFLLRRPWIQRFARPSHPCLRRSNGASITLSA